MPWVWSDELVNRLVAEGLLTPEASGLGVPPVAAKVDDPLDDVAAARALLGVELAEALAS